jgi:hypothetical protein
VPNTKAWTSLTSGERGSPPPISSDTLAAVETLIDECARMLGFTLNRATIEAAIFGASAARYVHHRAYADNGQSTEPGPNFEREMVVAMGLVRWLLVERLHRMEGA